MNFMKTRLISAMVIILMMALSCRKNDMSTEVKEDNLIRTGFTANFPGASNIIFRQVVPGQQEVSFTLDGLYREATINTNGVLVNNANEIVQSILPQAVLNFIQANPSCRVRKTLRLAFKNDDITFKLAAELEGHEAEIHFSRLGELIEVRHDRNGDRLIDMRDNNQQLVNVPAEVLSAFNTRYPDAFNIRWKKDDGQFEVEFYRNGYKWEATFKADGSFVKEEQEDFDVVVIPPAVLAAFTALHPNATNIYWESENNSNFEVHFSIGTQRWEAVFSPAGILIREQLDNNQPATVPQVVLDSFNLRFPGAAQVEWSKHGNEYRVEFNRNGTHYKARYSPAGVLLRLDIDHSGGGNSGGGIILLVVPAAVQTSFTSLFPNAINVSWRLQNGFYKAKFYIGNVRWEAKFKADGTLVEQEHD
jgi:Putative beta-lactamase-inhibitor-like, PepSY-like